MAELQVAFRGAEAFGQRLTRRLLDDARPAEIEPRARFGDTDVGQRGEARHDAAGARIDEDGDEGHPGLVEQVHRAARLGHLHEREDALLHARAA